MTSEWTAGRWISESPNVICPPSFNPVSISSRIPASPHELRAKVHKTNPEFICDIVEKPEVMAVLYQDNCIYE
jgi:hypothetical protein